MSVPHNTRAKGVAADKFVASLKRKVTAESTDGPVKIKIKRPISSNEDTNVIETADILETAVAANEEPAMVKEPSPSLSYPDSPPASSVILSAETPMAASISVTSHNDTVEPVELEAPTDYLAALATCPGYPSLDDSPLTDDEDVSSDTNATILPDGPVLFPPSTLKLPKQCQVYDESQQATSLMPLYKCLPNLENHAFLSWKSEYGGQGRMNFDTWSEWCPSMRKSFSFYAMTFVAFQRVVHLARCDPRQFAARINPRSITPSRFMTMSHSDAAVISLVPIRVTRSSLKDIGPRGKKFIAGIMHSQDMERFISVVCMVFGEKSMHCSLSDDEFSFETRAIGGLSSSYNTGSPYTASRSTATAPSPTRKRGAQSQAALSSGSGITAGYIRTSLGPTDEVRVYDGRRRAINWTSDMGKIHEILPQFHAEVPAGSFAVVAHTLTTYPKKTEGAVVGTAVSLNIQWVLLIGTPG